MRYLTAAAALFLFLTAGLSKAYADNFGPRNDVGTVRYDAQRLLAHHARSAKVDPKQILISEVVVVGDQAVLSWDIGKQHGLMGLVRQNNRWWDALDAAPSQGGEWFRTVAYPLQDVSGISKELQSAAVLHNADVGQGALGRYTSEIYSVPDVSIKSSGGLQNPMRSGTSGYEISIHYASNNAAAGAKFNRIYARPPTPAEFLPYPTPYRYVSDAVMFFDIIIDAPKPVSFQKGTTFDVWFPFVLDDTLKYNLSFGGGQEPVGPIAGTVFDNVVHFELPGFTALPGKELMGEIDGDLH